jgi:hypothetical protein
LADKIGLMPKLLLWIALLSPAFAYTSPMENQARIPDATEAAAILKAVCGAGAQVKDSPQGAQMSCSPCPDFTSLHGLTTEQFQLRFVLGGNFTAPDSQDLAAFFEGCELLSENFGGAVLLNKAGDGWKMARYDSALRPVAVRAIRLSAGRDELFGVNNSVGLGLDINSLFTFDFAQQGGTPLQTVLRVTDTRRACGYEITRTSLDQVTWQEQNFTATVSWGQIKSSPEYLRDCPDKIPTVPIQNYQVHFKFDGTSFQPTEDSKTVFDQITK